MTRIIIYSSLSIWSGYYGWIVLDRERGSPECPFRRDCVFHSHLSLHTLENCEECNKIYEEIIRIRVEDPPLNMLFINQDSFRYYFSRVLSAVSQEKSRINIKDPLQEPTVIAQWNQLLKKKKWLTRKWRVHSSWQLHDKRLESYNLPRTLFLCLGIIWRHTHSQAHNFRLGIFLSFLPHAGYFRFQRGRFKNYECAFVFRLPHRKNRRLGGICV
jgi:hypothetical protein